MIYNLHKITYKDINSIYIMAEELKRCARCHSKLLLEFFDKNRQGEFKNVARDVVKMI